MKIFKNIIKIIAMFTLLLILVAVCYVFIVASKANIDHNKLKAVPSPEIQIYDKNNILLMDSTVSDLKYLNISEHVVNAFTSIEDKTFFYHNGINIKRILGAASKNIIAGKIQQGGSTITQQLIKNTHLSTQKTISRKIQEIKLAHELEEKYSKKDILTMYLNKIYFGNGQYGIGCASMYYFNKKAIDLSIAESAYLAGIVKAPSYYAKNLEKAKERAKLVLAEMYKDKKISKDEYVLENQSVLHLNCNNAKEYINKSLYKYIKKEAENILSFHENIKIYTSLDHSIMKGYKEINKNTKENNLCIVIDNTTTDIVLLDSNAPIDFHNFKRQPGSIIKPLIPYGLALEENLISPSTMIYDLPCKFGSYSPLNYGNRYLGKITIRKAIMESSNIVAVKTMEYCNQIKDVILFAKKFNLSLDPNDNNLSLALGGITQGLSPINLAYAYSSLASNGKISTPSIIQKIKNGNDKVLYEIKKNSKQAVRDDTAFLLTDMLIATAQQGTAKKLASLKYPVAAKTGTCGNENGNTDAWTVAYTKNHTVLSWYGNPNYSYMPKEISGGTIPCERVKQVFSIIYKDTLPEPILKPNSIIEVFGEYYSAYNPPKFYNFFDM